LLEREPHGTKACRTCTRLNQTGQTTSAAYRGRIFSPARSAGHSREVGSGLRRMAGASCQRDLWIEVAGPRSEEWSRFISARLRSGSNHSTENRSLAYQHADTGRVVEVAAPVAFNDSVQQTGRVDLRLTLHEGPASVLAGTTSQETHQAYRAGRWPSQNW